MILEVICDFAGHFSNFLVLSWSRIEELAVLIHMVGVLALLRLADDFCPASSLACKPVPPALSVIQSQVLLKLLNLLHLLRHLSF